MPTLSILVDYLGKKGKRGSIGLRGEPNLSSLGSPPSKVCEVGGGKARGF